MPSAPAFHAFVACSTATPMLPPTPAITGMRPAVASTDVRTTAVCSSVFSEYSSPVPPAATMQQNGCAVIAATLARRPARSTVSASLNGVTGKPTTPVRRDRSSDGVIVDM